MAIDLLTHYVGGVDQAFTPTNRDMKTVMVNAQLQEGLGPQFAAQLASASPAAQSANVVSELSIAKKFEAIFVAQMMSSILPEDSEYFGEGFAGDAWRSMMSEQLANVAVKQTDFGIASLIDQSSAGSDITKSATSIAEPGVSSDRLSTFFDEKI